MRDSDLTSAFGTKSALLPIIALKKSSQLPKFNPALGKGACLGLDIVVV
jgi:hypothetical protein